MKQEVIIPNSITILILTGGEVLLADVPLLEMILIEGVAYDSHMYSQTNVYVYGVYMYKCMYLIF